MEMHDCLITPGVKASDFKRSRGNIDGVDFSSRKFRCHGDRDTAAAGCEIQNRGGLIFAAREKCPRLLDQQLGFRSGNEYRGTYGQFNVAERGCSEDVLKWLTFAAPFDEAPNDIELFLRQFALEIQIEV